MRERYNTCMWDWTDQRRHFSIRLLLLYCIFDSIGLICLKTDACLFYTLNLHTLHFSALHFGLSFSIYSYIFSAPLAIQMMHNTGGFFDPGYTQILQHVRNDFEYIYLLRQSGVKCGNSISRTSTDGDNTFSVSGTNTDLMAFLDMCAQ